MTGRFEERNGRKYSVPDWAIQSLWKSSGLLEDICDHGVGHPNNDFMKQHKKKMQGFEIHGCDGCCVQNNQSVNEKERIK